MATTWTKKRIDEVTERVISRAGIGSAPYVEIGDIDTDNKRYTLKDKPSPSICISATKGDIFVSKVRPTRGAITKAQSDVYASPGFSVLQPKINGDFVFYSLCREDFLRYLGTREMGTTYPSCDDVDIASYEIQVPSSTVEQEKIADILGTLDQMIEKTQALICKYERARAGMVQDLLKRGIDSKGQMRSEKTHKFKNSLLGRIPEEWNVGGFETVKHHSRPFIKTGPFGSSLKGEHWVDEGVPVITIGALGEGAFIPSELFFVTSEKAKTLDAYRVQSGDLVFSRVADVGRSVVVSKEQNDWIMSSNLMRIALDEKEVLPHFAHLNLVRNEMTRAQIRTMVNAGGREVANTAMLNSLLFSWPSLDEQKRIHHAVFSLEEATRNEIIKMRKMQVLKTGLLTDLLTPQ